MGLRWFVLVAGVVALTAGCVQTPERSGPYPDGDINLVVPAEAGENVDTVARAVAPCLARQLGVDVVVRNRPGEDGVRGNREVARADPDGHTLMISSVGPTVVTPLLLPDRSYRVEDFSFLGVVSSAPVVLFTAAESPVDTAEKLLAAAKAGSPPVTVAHRGDKTVEGFTLWHLNFLAETHLTSTPVGSDAEILRGVLAGDHAAGLATLTPELLSGIRSGEVRLLASGGLRRPEFERKVPTIYEVAGRTGSDAVPDLLVDIAFSAPANIGDARYATLSTALKHCLANDNVQRGIGADFLPANQVEPGVQYRRYRDLAHAVQLGLNMAKIEGR